MKDKRFVENILCPYFDFLTNFFNRIKMSCSNCLNAKLEPLFQANSTYLGKIDLTSQSSKSKLWELS